MEWIKCKNELPKETDKQYLVCECFKKITTISIGYFFRNCDNEPIWDCGEINLKVTHWMPLPKPPICN